MSVSQILKRIFTVDDAVMDEGFSLGEHARAGLLKPPPPEPEPGEPVHPTLAANRQRLEAVFSIPPNADVIMREFDIGTQPSLRAMAVFIEGLSRRDTINEAILKPLMQLAHLDPSPLQRPEPVRAIAARLLPGNQVTVIDKMNDAVEQIVLGTTAIFIEGCRQALVVETKGWDHRAVSEPQSEMLVRGPHEGFVENFRTNTALVRKILRTERLVTELTTVGRISRSLLGILYIEGLVNPELLAEVRRRIEGIQVDHVPDSGLLEQLLEDNPVSLVPSVLATQRPDRVAAFLSEGHVAILLDNSPTALVVPITFFALLHSAEDYYLRWPFGSFMRVVRVGAFFIALLLPALYVAVTNYHPEMVPTDLMLAIAGARERVPFPAIVEVLLMEGSFELIREAGLRIPTTIGPTIGIVGALILGQAAVQAGIVSPILVIVVALTALGSFGITDYSLQFGVRIFRFLLILTGGVLGIFGISAVLLGLAFHVTALKSFGVPVTAPIGPFHQSRDVILRGMFWREERRPGFVFTPRPERQAEITRPWWPRARRHRRRRRRQ